MNNDLLSSFVLGTASFGNQYGLLNEKNFIDITEAREVVKLFVENGGYNIDTSSCYGNSEIILSKVLNEFNNKKINITSKFELDENNNFEKVKIQIDKSFERFGRNLNTILCHTPEINKKNSSDFVFKVFNYIRENYSIKTGLSIYSKDELDNLDNCFKNEIKVIQAPNNIFDATASKLKENNLINQDTKVIARSIFLQGFLISNNCLIPEFLEEFETFKKLCLGYNLDSKEVCIRHAIQNQSLDFIVVGVNCIKHLNDLIHNVNLIKKNKHPKISNLESKNNELRLIDPRKWPK